MQRTREAATKVTQMLSPKPRKPVLFDHNRNFANHHVLDVHAEWCKWREVASKNVKVVGGYEKYYR